MMIKSQTAKSARGQSLQNRPTGAGASRFDLEPNARRLTRHLWMGSSSAIAAAIALSAAASPAHAQSAPGLSASASSGTLQAPQMDRHDPRIEGMRGGVNGRRLPRELPPMRAMPGINGNPIAAPSQTQVTAGSAPTFPSIQIDASQINSGPLAAPQISVPQRAQPVERAVITAPGIAGINVQAFAQYDDVQIDFNPGTGIDQVNVLASSAIINWTTFDGGAAGSEVTFLGAGGNLEFTSTLSDYTVLNRVLTPGFDSAIRIDGDIVSTTLGGNSIGGNIWFYSAGGIILGDTGSFNVGSLLLSTSDIDPADVVAGAFDVSFTGTPDSASSIRIDGGGTIVANNAGSYIAMVAPRIEQNGTVVVNGSAAYVAAEQANMTINNGLFDISVAVGTDDPNGIVHGATGSTGGPASTGLGDGHGIYFVAVPKNDAITMLVGGAIGYDAAAGATIENGQIILTSSDRVVREDATVFSGGSFIDVSTNTIDTSVGTGPGGNITLEELEITSSTTVFAEDTVRLIANGTADAPSITSVGDPTQIADLTLIGGGSVNLDVSANGLVDVSGSLNLISGDSAGNGGSVTVTVDQLGSPLGPLGGGELNIGGNLVIDASGQGFDDNGAVQNNGSTGIGSDGFGGSANIAVTGNGTITVAGNFGVDTSANGGRGLVRSGAATAGSIDLTVDSGVVNVGGAISLDAGARRAGTVVFTGIANEGSDSAAGNVTVNLGEGAVNATGLFVNVEAEATSGGDSSITQSNDASAGDFTLNVTGGLHSFGSIDVTASALSATSYSAAFGTSTLAGLAGLGTTTIAVSNPGTVLDVAGSVLIFARADGITGTLPRGAVTVSVIDTNNVSSGGFQIGAELDIFAATQSGGRGSVSTAADVTVLANNGMLSAGSLNIDASSSRNVFSPNFGIEGTDFIGGNIALTAANNGSLTFTQSSDLRADATGGVESNDPSAGIGQAGTISILADGGSITFLDNVNLQANGFAVTGVNSNGVSGQGIGGTVDITVQGASGALSFAGINAGTDGSFSFDGEFIDTFFIGAGSAGVGGLTQFNVLGGTLTATNITVSSDGEGGPGGDISGGALGPSGLDLAGAGGTGIGGDVVFNIDGGNASVVNLSVTANGIGGDGAFGSFSDGTDAGDGGAAFGGSATLNALSGVLTVANTLSVEATGNRRVFSFTDGGGGGNGFGSAGGNGGASTGGSAVFNLTGSAVVDAAQVFVLTQAFGGEGGDSSATFSQNPSPDRGGGDGGDAIGGIALFNDTAGDITFGSLTVDASGIGGQGGGSFGQSTGDAQGEGGAGGNGVGGSALISLNQNDADPKNYNVISRGVGGEGGIGAIAGFGGLGQGGIAELSINNVAVVFDTLFIDTSALGGAGGFVDGQVIVDGADGGDAEAGEARLIVAGQSADFQANTSVSINAGAAGGAGRSGAFNSIGSGPSGNGGAGGDSLGGSATISVTDGANITIDASTLSLSADSVGGAGGDGESNFSGGDGGNGGVGGDGVGGIIGFTAETGAAVSILGVAGQFTLSSTGTGGAGGVGGGSGSAIGGIGGDGGAGVGGSPLIRATGATITIGDVDLIALGQGGQGGQGGQTDIFGSQSVVITSPDGAGGAGTGGSPLIEVLEGSPGILNLGDVFINATGAGGTGLTTGLGIGGQVVIRDRSIDPAGLISMGGLTIDATGDPATDQGSILITSDSGPVTVAGALTAAVTGDIDLSMIGDGQLVVSGATLLNASRTITIRHASQTIGINSVDTAGTFTAAALDFAALDNGDINTAQAVSITAENITYDNITTTSTVDLTATNGSITGSATGTITAANVLDAIDLIATQNVTFGNLVSTAGDIDIDAGADITGVTANSAQFIEMDAPGTITVDLVTNALNPIGLVTINGGAIDIGTLEAGFISNLTSATGDLAVDTIISSTSTDLDSAGDIIIGTASTGGFVASAVGDFTAGSVTTTGGTADLRISAGGTASYTALNSDRLLQIDAAQIIGGDAIADASITYNASAIDVGDITSEEAGNIAIISDTNGIATGAITAVSGLINVNSAAAANVGSAQASASLSVVSNGDLTIGDASAGNNMTINSGADLSAGNLFAGATSPGLGITAAGDANILSAGTNGLLDVNIAGALTGGDFTGASLTTIDAGSAVITSVQSLDQSVSVNALGAVSVGNASSNFGTTITGTSVNIDNGDIGTFLNVTSSVGDITGLGSIVVGGSANFNSAANIGIGTLEAANISLTSAGDLRFNGLISPNAITLSAIGGTIGATTPGEGDIDSGGAVDLVAEDIDLGDINSAASITATTSIGDAGFGALTAGTFINIDAAGSPVAESVTSGGDVTLSGASIALNGGDIGGNLTLTARSGDITLAFDAAQQLIVGGGALFGANGAMSVTHTNNASGVNSVDVAGGVGVNVGGSFTSGAGSILNAGGELLINSGGSITADDLRSAPGIVLSAGGDVLLRNASATGPQGISNFRGIVIEAGVFDLGSGTFVFDNLANAVITGNVTSYADIDITAGGNAVFAAGSNTAADNVLAVFTGDDIIVEAGAILSSANNPTDAIDPLFPFESGPNLILNAGGEQNLLSLPTTPIASLVMDGTLNANDGAIILQANAIDGLDSTLIAGSIQVDVRDAPATTNFLSDDDGLLSDPCLEGVACLGNMDATGRIEIGQNSNNDIIALFIEQASVSATDILITTRNDIVMGTNGINTVLNATGTFSATSNTGDVDLRDASISADQILIEAAGSLIGSGVLTSDNDIGITVGDSIIVGGIITTGELTEVANVGGAIEGSYSVAGSFIAGVFSQGSSSIDLTAGNSIDIAAAGTPGDITLSAVDVFLGQADAPGSIFISGDSVGFDLLGAGGTIDISGGDVLGGDLGAADVSISGDQIDIGNIDAVNLASITGVSVAVGDVRAGSVDFVSDTDIVFNLIQSSNDISLAANGGQIGANTGPGDIITDGDVTLSAQTIAIGAVDAGGAVDATATTGGLTAETIVSGGAVSLAAGNGTVFVPSITAGGDVLITGLAVDLDDVTADGAVTVSGETIGFTAIDAGTDVSLTASSGALSGVSVTAGGSADLVAGGGTIALSTLTANDANLQSSGAIVLGDAIVAQLLTAQGASVAIVSSSDLAIAADASDGDLSVQAAGDLDAQSASSSAAVSLISTGGNVSAGSASAQDMVIGAAGDVSITDNVDVQGALSIDAGAAFSLSGTATAQTIAVTAADANIGPDGILGDATRTQTIGFTTAGEIYLGGAGGLGTAFEIDNGEFSRIHSGGNIEFSSLGSSGNSGGSGGPVVINPSGAITVDTLDVIAGNGGAATGQNIGQGGALVLQSLGDITIIGDASILGATLDTSFIADAAELVRLNTATGGIFVLDGNEGITGTISILATDFIAATDDAFADIAGLSVADVDTRLGNSDGVERADGVIRADTLDVATTASQVFIQNTVSGTDFDDRRGFEVNTLNISSGGAAGSLQPIVVNGVIGGVTGFDAIPLANILNAADPASTINGCVIADPASCVTGVRPPTGGPDPEGPGPVEVETRDLIDEGLDPDQPVEAGVLVPGLFEVRPDSAFAPDPLIDDPVTGAGNEDLWVSDEEPDAGESGDGNGGGAAGSE